ncbi:hypothetical protein CCHR01_13217 [Colletotrichum chrysophilum]|uniref:Uncharacterized protein n=1 Tax=Colletotrichum chrysophilum TaxID=1836956 RepID=A0AAD9ACM2_9PEZI|nr:hypothetical protein CCHR01_13217 [Colletotrichum chrysophilum]
MLFSKTILLIAAAIVPSVMAGCKAGAPFQGTCLSCTSDCHDSTTAALTGSPLSSVLDA